MFLNCVRGQYEFKNIVLRGMCCQNLYGGCRNMWISWYDSNCFNFHSIFYSTEFKIHVKQGETIWQIIKRDLFGIFCSFGLSCVLMFIDNLLLIFPKIKDQFSQTSRSFSWAFFWLSDWINHCDVCCTIAQMTQIVKDSVTQIFNTK